MERVNLQEGWRFAKANSNEWTPVSVPGTVLSEEETDKPIL